MGRSFLPVMAYTIVYVHVNTVGDRLIIKKNHRSVREITQKMNVSSGNIDTFVNAYVLKK